jgi:hypothetical protein
MGYKYGLWDYLKQAWAAVRLRLRGGKVVQRRPCIDCKWLGNLPRGQCERCGPPSWERYEFDAAGDY